MCPAAADDAFVTFPDDSDDYSEKQSEDTTKREEYLGRLPPKKKQHVDFPTDTSSSSTSQTFYSDVTFLKEAYWATGAFFLVALVIIIVIVAVANGKSKFHTSVL